MPEPMADEETLKTWPRIDVVLVAKGGPVLLSSMVWPCVLQDPDTRELSVGVSLCIVDKDGGMTQLLALKAEAAETIASEVARVLAIGRAEVDPPMPEPGPNPPALDLSAFPVPPPSGTP